MVTDGKEEAVYLDIKNSTILSQETCSRDSVLVSQDLLGVAVPQDLDIGSREDLLLHGDRCPENIPSHDHVDLAADGCKVCRLLACCVSTSYYGYVLLPVEESVAGGAGGDPQPLELLLRGKAKVACSRPRCNDDGLGDDSPVVLVGSNEGTLRQVYLLDAATPHPAPEPLGLLPQGGHQHVGVDSLGEAGIVLHGGCCRELASGLHTLVEDGLQGGPGGVDPGGVARRTGTDYEALCLFHLSGLMLYPAKLVHFTKRIK